MRQYRAVSQRAINVLAGVVLTVLIVFGMKNYSVTEPKLEQKQAALKSVLRDIEKPPGATLVDTPTGTKWKGYSAGASYTYPGSSAQVASFFESSLRAKGWRLCRVIQPVVFGHKRTDWERVFVRDPHVIHVYYMTPEAKAGWIFSLTVLYGPPEVDCS